MKRLLLATTACVGMAVAAQAADLPARAAPPPVYVPPAFTWTGFYVGVNAGYGFDTRRNDNNGFFPNDTLLIPANNAAFNPGSGFTTTNPLVPNATPFFVVGPAGSFTAPGTILTFNNGNGFNNNNRRRDGFVGGGQIGYNWQLTPGAGLVIGIEADAQFADLNRQRSDFFGANNGIAFGPGIAGAPLFTNPVVVPIVVGTGGTAAPAGAAGTVLAGLPSTLLGGAFAFNPTFVAPPGGVLGVAAAAAPVGPVTFFNPFANGGIAGNRGVDWFGTVRGRLGYGFDRTLIYVTGGLAYGGGNSNNNDGFNNGIGTFGFGGNNGFLGNGNDRIRVGYTVGGGLEYAFTNNLSVKLEGLFVSLSDRNNSNNFFFNNGSIPFARDAAGTIYSAPAAAFTNNTSFLNNSRRRDTEFAVVRVGLNYKFDLFGGGYAQPGPVVARY